MANDSDSDEDVFADILEAEDELLLAAKEAHEFDFFGEFFSINARWDVICEVVTKRPSICQETDEWDMVPLHLVCMLNAPLHVIELLANTWPQALFDADSRWIPLHLACKYNATIDVIHFLVEKSPHEVIHQ